MRIDSADQQLFDGTTEMLTSSTGIKQLTSTATPIRTEAPEGHAITRLGRKTYSSDLEESGERLLPRTQFRRFPRKARRQVDGTGSTLVCSPNIR